MPTSLDFICAWRAARPVRSGIDGNWMLRALVFGGVAGLFSFVPLASATTPLVQLSPTVYQTEHCLFVIDSSVTWASPSAAYNDLYAYPFTKLNNAYDILTTQFPGTYFSVCYIANTGDSHVPSYIDRTAKASGINESMAVGASNTFATTDLCRYNLPGGSISPSMLAVFDHELGHAWGARAFYGTAPYPSLSDGHWLSNSTVDCQMSGAYSADGYVTVNKLYGDPVNGFRWQKTDNLRSNDYEEFSEQTLYLMGLRKTWPTAYVLNNVVYNPDLTASFSTVDTFDHAMMIAAYGARSPDYTTEQKRLKVGFVYIARDVAEVNAVYQNAERSVSQFCDGETIDPQNFRYQTPFLCNTHFRASVDGLIADLDGNATPTLSVTNPYVVSSDGSATIDFVAADPDGAAPTVSLVPATASCAVVGNSIQATGLPDGVHFFTVKATDAGGKKVFGHFIVEVQRPVTSTAITVQPVGQTVVAGNPTSFSVTATGTPASFTYQWYRQAARESAWNILTDGGVYSGTTTSTLTVDTTTAANGDRFLCLVGNATGTATSADALLTVNEAAPLLGTQPTDRSIAAGGSTSFTVAAGGPPTTFGYFYYQWQRLAAGGSTWSDLVNGGGYSGTTTATLGVVTNLGMSGDQFRCVVSNTAGSTTSNAASLTVGTVPAIATQPISPVTLSAGQGASFTVAATGTSPLAYQWSRYGVPVAGATNATITFTNAQSADAGAYTVDVTNAFGLARSNVGSLTVTAAAPSITAAPQSLSVVVGQGASFSVSATGTSPFTYQWKKNGSPISGATASSLGLTNVQNSDAGSYTVVVTNSVNSVTSAAATLTVNAKTVASVVLGNLSATYDGSAHAATATTTPASLAVDFTYDGSPATPLNAGTYTVVATINDANYQGTASGTLVVAQANAVITWAAPSPVLYGTALSSTQLNATASVGGTFQYSPAVGTVLSPGNHTLSVGFTPTDAINFAGASTQVSLTIQVDGRIPAGFDVMGYLSRYPAVAAAYGTDLYGAWVHYHDQGIYDGEVFDDVFRVEEYLALYPELFALFGSDLGAALDHWLSTGRIEGKLGRIPTEFSAAGYFTRNADVAAAVNNDAVLAWGHYWLYGIYEGRAYDDELSVFEYLAINADLTAAFVNDWRQAALHWMRYGRGEGRLGRLPLTFDVTTYLDRNPDVLAVYGTNPTTVFLHFWAYGINEGRTYDDVFRVDDYLTLNPDLAATFGTDRRGAFKHWVRYGQAEGRLGKNP